MAAVVIDGIPFIPKKPYIVIGTDPDTVQFECAAEDVTVEASQDENSIETFCGIYKSYKPAEWTATVSAYLSYGAEGLWNALHPLANTIVDVEIRPDNADPVSESNPSMTGPAYLADISFLSTAVGKPNAVDVVLAFQGEPTWSYVPGATTLSADEESVVEEDDVEIVRVSEAARRRGRHVVSRRGISGGSRPARRQKGGSILRSHGGDKSRRAGAPPRPL